MDNEIKLTKLEGRIEHLETKVDDFLTELRSELKEIKLNTSQLQTLSLDYTYIKESMSRAFHRLEKAEDQIDNIDGFIHQFEGAKKLAWVLWSIMGTGIIAVISRVFFGV